MFGSVTVDVIIGLVFIYFTLSIACSAIQEMISAKLGWRAKDLEQAIGGLLGNANLAGEFWKSPFITPLCDSTTKGSSSKPSYLSAEAFVTAVASLRQVGSKTTALAAPSPDLQAGPVKSLLASEKIEKVDAGSKPREELESLFNDAMDRASGWYKRRAQWVLLCVGILLVGLANADTLQLVRALSTSSAIRVELLASAKIATAAGPATDSRSAKAISDQLTALPLGWSLDPSSLLSFPTDLGGWISKVVGLLITILAVSFGASFWFDLLNKLVNGKMRLTGAKPPTQSASNPPTA